MTLAQKINAYSKALVASVTAIITLVTSLVATLSPILPDGALPVVLWINTAIGFATVALVWLAKNEPLIEAVANQVDGDPTT